MYSDDSLQVNIDNKTIIESNNELSVNVYSLVDNDKIVYEDNEIRINLSNFDKANNGIRDLFKIDGRRIKEDGNYL